jgi:hypothetical protein
MFLGRQDLVLFLKLKSHTWFMPHSPLLLPTQGKLDWGDQKGYFLLQSLVGCQAPSLTVSSKITLLDLGDAASLSRPDQPPSSVWKMLNFWINLESYLFILWRAHADLPLHRTLKCVYNVRVASSSCLCPTPACTIDDGYGFSQIHLPLKHFPEDMYSK